MLRMISTDLYEYMTCDDGVGGYCYLPKICSDYTSAIWDENYAFKFEFADTEYDSTYFTVPLAALTFSDDTTS